MWEVDCSQAPREKLREQGFWTCEGAVSEETASEVRQEILAAHAAGLLTQSGNVLAVRLHDGGRGGVTREKPNVFEADLVLAGAASCPKVLQQSPVLAALLAQEGMLRKTLNESWPWLVLDRLEQAKVQVNSGNGGAFPCHFDLPSAAAKGARRVLTALLYLNSDWREGDGGEVEILPFPFPDVPVAPCDRRLVLFSSCTTLHRVRPYTGACGRVCINLWFEGEVSVPFPAPLPPCERYDAQACKIVRILRQQPAELRAFCKVWYANTMAESLRDAFEPSEELDAALALHFEEMRAVESRIAPTTLEVLRECLPFKETPLVLRESETADLSGLFDGM
ncbi:unnamed protein product [Polarella glacialis]|uniref:Fe2OG dioxygenase domain-containing protein n=1 Tax=Polarella glacialis TaxID=89957 RepID=A0A813HPG9_POLGL|nr:unnamed protein product [Polarella glacialis]